MAMHPDPADLRNHYSKMTTEELIRLSGSGELTAEAQWVLDVELSQRSDRGNVELAGSIREYAAAELARGIRGPELEEALVKGGLDSATAGMIVRDAANAIMRARRDAIKNKITLGIIALVAGVLVTVFTYEGAENTGGYYFVAGGAILFGILEVLRGGWALFRDRKPL